ncbi:MAG: acyltransferase domain-containing protein [Acidobacteriaceae bacterium]|nr:acyltransferase domain-containing protein [Acidobacteriaceae bacterium]
MSGSFPGSADLDEFWSNLCLGRELIRFGASSGSGDLRTDSSAGRWVPVVSCMDGIDLFDAEFFGMSPHEAEITDPQHRILLEHSWRAIEHAGYDPRRHKGETGVFAGATINTYLLQNIAGNPGLMRSLDPVKLNIGNGADFLTTRISYKLNLHGPSHTVQSACSTSLVAVHCACRSLLDFECDMALAGGVSVNVTLLDGYWYQDGGILSPDGHCRPFDLQAQGTVFGSGVGVVILKRLQDALADGDFVHAVICGSAINNDGAQKAGYTAPSVDGQTEVIVEALSSAGIEPDKISYVECHGTATPLGDPIEIGALTRAFGERKTQPCAIGSVKSNIGHLDAAAGITGLIKVVLCLKNRLLPPSLHYERSNPEIKFSETPFYVNTELLPWKSGDDPLRAGVSAFGVGGTNAHIVLEEALRLTETIQARSWQVLPFSARTKKALANVALELSTHFRKHADLNLEDAAYTLQTGRHRFALRTAVVCQDRHQAAELLEEAAKRVSEAEEVQEKAPSIVFLFPGQGAQRAAIGSELYQWEPVFRQHLDRCSDILRPHLGLDLNAIVKGEPTGAERINETWLAQPVLFSIEYALAQLWMSWGIQPRALVGHSLGEYTAACISGVINVEDALVLVAERGKLMQQTPPGAMIAVWLPWERVQGLMNGELEVAAINAPNICVVSGAALAMADFEDRLNSERITCRRLVSTRAFHSKLMDPVIERHIEEMSRIVLRAPKIPLISCVTGKWLREEEATNPAYWGQQMRAPVRFSDGLREVIQQGHQVFLEVGPGRGLCHLASLHCEETLKPMLLSSLPGTNNRSECEMLMNALARIWSAGAETDWTAFHACERRLRIPLPTYPFERRRYWIESRISAPNSAPSCADQEPSDACIARPSPSNPRPALRNEYVAPTNELEETVVTVMEKVLGIHPIGVTDRFGELGGDSLAAIGLIAELNATLRSTLTVVDFYDQPTAREAASLVASTRVSQIPGSHDRGRAEKEANKTTLRDSYIGFRKAIRKTDTECANDF